ncbi:hypothetical protein DERP_004846 [Dermatophagoides pteronyssinus]|uniref:Uncharacterized protein n=1 Tax=Dermatophagoides pteronyssinus TaxID=6956 RepID=A0ABQ8JSP3_DERPT|nr:hypothetical protein DERP_004846 [Dermatophagoides pteronyssinus]
MKLSLLICLILSIHIGHSFAKDIHQQSTIEIDSNIEQIDNLLKQINAKSFDDDVNAFIQEIKDLIAKIGDDITKAMKEGRDNVDDIIKKIQDIIQNIVAEILILPFVKDESERNKIMNTIQQQVDELKNYDAQLNSASSIIQSKFFLIFIMVINFLIFKSFS